MIPEGPSTPTETHQWLRLGRRRAWSGEPCCLLWVTKRSSLGRKTLRRSYRQQCSGGRSGLGYNLPPGAVEFSPSPERGLSRQSHYKCRGVIESLKGKRPLQTFV